MEADLKQVIDLLSRIVDRYGSVEITATSVVIETGEEGSSVKIEELNLSMDEVKEEE